MGSSKFDECVKKEGDIKTTQKKKGWYQRTCTIDGKTYKDIIRKKKPR